MKKIKKNNRRRYYLHAVLKKNKIKYNPYLHTIYLRFNESLDNPHITKLRDEFNYSIQLEI